MEAHSGFDIGALCFTDTRFCDCMLSVGSDRFPVHRVIISRLSSFFDEAFRFNEPAPQHTAPRFNEPAQHPELNLTLPAGFEKYFPLVLRYLYGGTVALTEHNAVYILLLADFLGISPLYNQTLSFCAVAVQGHAQSLFSLAAAAVATATDPVLDLCLFAAVSSCWRPIVSLCSQVFGGESADERERAAAALRTLPLECARVIVFQRSLSILHELERPYFEYYSPATHATHTLGATAAALSRAAVAHLIAPGSADWQKSSLSALLRAAGPYGRRALLPARIGGGGGGSGFQRAHHDNSSGPTNSRGSPQNSNTSINSSSISSNAVDGDALWLASASAAGDTIARLMKRRDHAVRRQKHRQQQRQRQSESRSARYPSSSASKVSPPSSSETSDSSSGGGGCGGSRVPPRDRGLRDVGVGSSNNRNISSGSSSLELSARRAELSLFLDALLLVHMTDSSAACAVAAASESNSCSAPCPASCSVDNDVSVRVPAILEHFADVAGLASTAPVLRGATLWRLCIIEVLAHQQQQLSGITGHSSAESSSLAPPPTFLPALAASFSSPAVRGAIADVWRAPLWDPLPFHSAVAAEVNPAGAGAVTDSGARYTGPHLPPAARVPITTTAAVTAAVAAGSTFATGPAAVGVPTVALHPSHTGGFDASRYPAGLVRTSRGDESPAGITTASSDASPAAAAAAGSHSGPHPLGRPSGLEDDTDLAAESAAAAATEAAAGDGPQRVSRAHGLLIRVPYMAATAATGGAAVTAASAGVASSIEGTTLLLLQLGRPASLGEEERRRVREFTYSLFDADELAVAMEDELVSCVMDIICGEWGRRM